MCAISGLDPRPRLFSTFFQQFLSQNPWGENHLPVLCVAPRCGAALALHRSLTHYATWLESHTEVRSRSTAVPSQSKSLSPVYESMDRSGSAVPTRRTRKGEAESFRIL